MIRPLLIGFFFLVFTSVRAQEVLFRVAPFFSVSLPAIPDSMQTKSVKVYMVYTDSIYYQAVVDTKKLKIKNKADFESGLKGMYHGFKSKLSGFAVQTNDTIIGGKQGLFAFAVSKEISEKGNQVFVFFTIIDGHCCMVQCSTLMDAPAQKGVESFFNSARFKGENYPVEQHNKIAFFIGQLLGYGLISAALFFFIRFVIRLIRRLNR